MTNASGLAPGKERRMSAAVSIERDDLLASEEELRWYFTEAAAAIGFHGQGFEVFGKSTFDEARSEALHQSKLTHRARKDAQKLLRIEPIMHFLSPDQRETAKAAYTPRSWSAAVRTAFTIRRDVCLAELAVRTMAAHRLRDATRPGEGVREFLAWEAGACAKAKRVPVRLLKVREEAEALLDAVLRVYEPLRSESIRRENENRRLKRERDLAGLM